MSTPPALSNFGLDIAWREQHPGRQWAGPPMRVLLAEPDAAIRRGIRLSLEADGIEIAAEPLDAGGAIAEAARELPDICLIDEALRGGAVLAVGAIYQRLPATKIVMLTDCEEPKSLFAAISAGASGYVRKDRDPARLAATLRGVLDGEAALSRRVTYLVLENLRTRERGRSAPTKPGGPSMTNRQLEVLELMAEGLRTCEIAARLSIAEVTVRRHVSSAMTKLGVADRDAAITTVTAHLRPALGPVSRKAS